LLDLVLKANALRVGGSMIRRRAPTSINHMCCRWWRGTSPKSTGKTLHKNSMVHCTC